MERLLLVLFAIEDTSYAVHTVHRWLRAMSIREHDIASGAPPIVQRLNDAILSIHSSTLENLTPRKAA